MKTPYKPPKWFTALPVGSHGSTPAQKRLWKVLSDIVRREDFKLQRGKCVSCPRVLARWQDGQAAHFKPYSVCHGWFKFQRENLGFSCPFCNQNSGGDVGYAFGEALKKRYGKTHLGWIQTENEKRRGEKIQEWEIVEVVAKLLGVKLSTH